MNSKMHILKQHPIDDGRTGFLLIVSLCRNKSTPSTNSELMTIDAWINTYVSGRQSIIAAVIEYGLVF